MELRYYLGSAHYRSVLEYSEAALTEAAAGYRRIEDFLAHFDDLELGEWTQGFADAMNDDIAVPKALAEIHTTVRAGNKALAAGDEAEARTLAGQVRAMAHVLGFDPLEWEDGAQASGRMPRWMRWYKLSWARRRARIRTSLLPTPSVTASRPPASPSPIPQTARPGRWRSVKHSERTINYGTYPRPRWRGNPQDQ